MTSPVKSTPVTFSDRVIVSIIGDDTYIIGTQEKAGRIMVRSDKMRVPGHAVTSVSPVTTAILASNEVISGYLEHKSDETVTLRTQDGILTTTKYNRLVTDLYKTHYCDIVRPVQINVIFNRGLVASVSSVVVSSTGSTYVIEQYVKIVNKLPYNLTNIKDLQISFQDTGVRHRRSLTTAMAEVESKLTTPKEVEESSNIISLGSVPVMERDTTTTFPPSKGIVITVKERYTTVNLDSPSLVTTEVVMVNGDTTLLPSRVYFNNENGIPMMSFEVSTQSPRSIFEVNMGSNTNVTVLRSEKDYDKYVMEIASNIDRRQSIRVTGWSLEGRKDVFVLEPRETKILEGRMPLKVK